MQLIHISLKISLDSVLVKESTPGVVTPSKRVGVSRSRTFGNQHNPNLKANEVAIPDLMNLEFNQDRRDVFILNFSHTDMKCVHSVLRQMLLVKFKRRLYHFYPVRMKELWPCGMTIHENVETVLTFEVKTKVSEREPVTGLAVCAWSAGFRRQPDSRISPSVGCFFP